MYFRYIFSHLTEQHTNHFCAHARASEMIKKKKKKHNGAVTRLLPLNVRVKSKTRSPLRRTSKTASAIIFLYKPTHQCQ